MDNQNSETKIKSIERIHEYPIVKDSFTKASEYYNWIKGKNSTLNSTLTWTENNVKSAIGAIEPIASSQLGKVDNFACNQLDKIENKYPIIKESSENILKSSSEYYDSSIKPQVVSAKDSAVNLVTTPFRIASQSIEYLSSTTNNFVNGYMSRSSTHGTETREKKEYDILFGRALREIDTIRSYAKRNVEGLSNILFSIYDQSVTKNRDLINKFYQEYADEVKNKDGEHATSELALMELVTSLSNKLRISVRAMSTVCYNHMDANSKEKLDLVFNKTEQMYSKISQTTYNDVREQISMENVKWIGQSTIGLLAQARDVLIAKYKEETGQAPNLDSIDESQNKDEESACDGTDHSSTNVTNQ